MADVPDGYRRVEWFAGGQPIRALACARCGALVADLGPDDRRFVELHDGFHRNMTIDGRAILDAVNGIR